MSMPYIPDDDLGELMEFTKKYFVHRIFYDDPDCTWASTRFRGKYQKVSKYAFENPRPRTKFLLEDVEGLKKPAPTEGELDDGLNDYIENDAVLVWERIELNPDYDLEHYQKEFESSLEAIAIAEKEGYRLY